METILSLQLTIVEEKSRIWKKYLGKIQWSIFLGSDIHVNSLDQIPILLPQWKSFSLFLICHELVRIINALLGRFLCSRVVAGPKEGTKLPLFAEHRMCVKAFVVKHNFDYHLLTHKCPFEAFLLYSSRPPSHPYHVKPSSKYAATNISHISGVMKYTAPVSYLCEW